MAETVALVASFAALVQIAGYANKFATVLYDVSQGAGSAMEQIENFAIQARTFSDTVDLAQTSLKRHRREFKESPVLEYISRHRVLENIVSKSTRKRLYDATRRVKKTMRSRSPLIVFLRWMYQKSSITALFPEMEHIKSSISLIVNTATFEVIMSQMIHSSSRAEKKQLEGEIKRLEMIIESQLRTIDRLEVQLIRLHGPHSSSDESIGLIKSTNRNREVLFKLGKSILHSGRVPGTSSHLSSSVKHSKRQKSRRQTHIPPCLEVNVSAVGPALDLPRRAILRSNEDSWDESTSGYVQSADGQRIQPVTAFISKALECNVISIATMVYLGLVMEEDEGSGVDWLGFEHGKEEIIIGYVILTWMCNDYPSRLRPALTVRCEVSGNCQRGLVFGKPFSEEVRQKWRNREDNEEQSVFETECAPIHDEGEETEPDMRMVDGYESE
ncbi:hypothetical protein B0J13DRAFT_143248 [Dactylonectria estremocensis]|uniref:Fungal N-terminal domain-containing protein n=1 Tax=Dactylonectria estremocensis TaxID=1079267 RepID=A0A9P9IR02_9HYPO|nr:hypothetical protein B0J13DRAFT_143248 [Dactylonectria estremocensis]